MKLKTLGSLLLMLLALSSFAQNGTISGKVVDEVTGEEMVGVTIQVLSNGKFATTDLFGDYAIRDLAPGTYTIEVKYVSYSTKRISDIVVAKGANTTVNITMQEKVEEVGEVVVEASYKKRIDKRVTGSKEKRHSNRRRYISRYYKAIAREQLRRCA
ncbi:carboxypeptidase-like regulatory domain-containing protein [Oscillatoria amoena NRMC-F 0135]|nr:carboxypeptidase-like regulatory domain-containing protein [Oscillatoria amoena NRMC-F 0135]